MNDVVNHNHVLNIEASIVHKLCNCLATTASMSSTADIYLFFPKLKDKISQ